jgi:two-component system, sensor histidine kinase and response regulator
MKAPEPRLAPVSKDGSDKAGGTGSDRPNAPTAGTLAPVLVVDDVEANLVAVEALLEPLRCKVVRAHSGDEALRRVLVHEFAVILLDVMMPGLDGIATAQIIKSRPSTCRVPIIFLTAIETRSNEISLGYAQGAVDFLVKPVDPDILRSKVAVFVELFQQRQELKAQTELAQQREREAVENRRLYESERGARAHAEAIARAREHILAVVSHDLRNPMSVIATKAGLLKRKHAMGQAEDVSAGMELIERNIRRMEALVSDLLDTARIKSGNLSIDAKTEAVLPMVQQATDQLRPALSTKAQRLEVAVSEGLPSARCDRDRVFQVFSNLVGNASKYSREGTTIQIEAQERPGEILFVVSDQGSGIAPDHLPHIFEPYWQASPERRHGLGLGLAIVKGIIEAHQSRIWVESRPGTGTQFYFTLPIAEEVTPATS